MKILIISRTPWNISNSFGNTFTNLFGGMEGIDIFNICCQSGSTTNDVVKETLQLSEHFLLHSSNVNTQDNCTRPEATRVDQIQELGKKKRSAWMFFARDVIWRLTAFKWKKIIGDFITKVNPDIVYIPIYASLYMCDVDYYTIKQFNIPVVGHISDDVYGYSPVASTLSLAHYYRYTLRKKIRAIIRRCSYLEVFAENMKEEYEKEFGKPCYLIGKGVIADNVQKPKVNKWEGDIHFVYTGGIGGERFSTLIALAHSLERYNTSKRCYLDIYTATSLSDNDKKMMMGVKSIIFHGAISGDDVKEVQANADCLVHVEGFSPQTIFETRMSFSTKIIDYLSTGNLMLAIGSEKINSINVLSNNNMAVVINELKKLDNTVDRLLYGCVDRDTIQNNAYKYLIGERNRTLIQERIFNRLKAICNIY